MKEKREIVYLKADRNSVCHDPKIKIQDVMSVQCADPAICAGIKNKTLYTFKKNDGQKKEGKKKKRMVKQDIRRKTTIFFMTISLFPRYTQKSKNKAIPRKQMKSR